MAVPVFREKKNGVVWILTYACVTEWPLRAVCPSLGRLRGLLCTFSSLQASKVATRELRLLESTAILEREASAQICEGLIMRVVRGGHFWQLGSIVSLVTEKYRWVILAALWPKHGLRSALRVPNLKKIPGRACPQTPYIMYLV